MATSLTTKEIVYILEGDISDIDISDDEDISEENPDWLLNREAVGPDVMNTEVQGFPNIPDVGLAFEVNKCSDDSDDDDMPLAQRYPHLMNQSQRKVNRSLWTYEDLGYVDSSCDSQFSPPPDEISTPFSYFKLFVDNDMISNIVEQTNLYSVQEKCQNVNTNDKEIHQLLGIHMIMSIVTMPSYSMFWSEKSRYGQIADVMSRNRFKTLRGNLHFNNNDNMLSRDDPAYDKLFKIRPFLNALRKNFLKVEPEEHNSVDEFMIPLKAHTALKQYMKSKPHKWGVKVFARAGVSGFVYDFEIYLGKQTNVKESGLGISGDIVIRLAENIPKHKNFKLYCDNWFSSPKLFSQLRKDGILAAGTIRRNRLGQCTLKSDKELKKQGRGSFDYRLEKSENTFVLKWLDNKPVYLISNFVGAHPVENVRRWSVAEKRYIDVPQPNIVRAYNKHMGGVDKQDMLLELYRTNLKGKRYYLRVIFHFIDLSVVNAWLLYRRHCEQLKEKYMPLIEFKLSVAHALLYFGPNISNKRGRPSSSPSVEGKGVAKRTFTPRPVADVRFDGIDHWPLHVNTKNRCKLCIKSYTRVKCEKCNLPLCFSNEKNCFKTFHVK
ncbi:piggyBac transposable element-derived protein 2-like [Ischnura elegans]|uniref:piggyBac transposable element-derived protein 2-like n=1 Tax=Ischnura elegans TaxID=197161 RepID=UPI001ED8BA8C|nr:piggyBac transposable element-derived protein 2-like [Ischnura elegans]XP_046385203.1 piggyBac transposable element-derived protein 2-like [Ischnura elegans]XP_046389104.1 piggyBac transposable element-derived protein 2-like [Ischnura elegans]XP_046390596.1 piggyBac transposable element-derived protein 2-like [Ischnura elegans]XP_046392009.1 piggyBac transposable element-derived protein 2-like [Ischnura elegans]XP_046394462.1 piggyBac transposable element-derived protein 2-like [Ischnura el